MRSGLRDQGAGSTMLRCTECQHEAPHGNRARRTRRLLLLGSALVAIWLLVAYVIVPLVWRTDSSRHPGIADAPRITHTANGIPGDPLNIGLVGSEADVVHAMAVAGWDPADPITFRTSLRIVVASVIRRPDDDAPVSDLYLFGRKQDLAHEQPVGDSPRQRHHVRFWQSETLDQGRPLWFGAATFDERVGLSHRTGQVTHHIGPDIDAERDRIVAQLQKAGEAQEIYWVNGFQKSEGKNGGGDPWHTDGRLSVAVLAAGPNPP